MISVIVPVYNAAPYLEETLSSITAQTYQDVELVLVDDCSTDDSVEVIRRFLEKNACNAQLIVLDKETGGTAAKARNEGLFRAKGRYIAYLDADDVWAKDKLEKTLRFMEETKAPFVFTAYEFGDEAARGTGKVVHVPDKLTYEKALSRTVVFTSTVLLDREQLSDELLRMPEIASEDTATWWQIMRSGVTARGLNESLTIYRRPAGKSLSSNKLEAIRRIWGLYRHEGLSFGKSAWNFAGWALRSTLRRI